MLSFCILSLSCNSEGVFICCSLSLIYQISQSGSISFSLLHCSMKIILWLLFDFILKMSTMSALGGDFLEGMLCSGNTIAFVFIA